MLLDVLVVLELVQHNVLAAAREVVKLGVRDAMVVLDAVVLVQAVVVPTVLEVVGLIAQQHVDLGAQILVKMDVQ